jgi:hypothetical protein
MFQLAYLSSTRGLLTPDEIAEILIVSRENNSKRGITGVLLYKGGNVLQVLEGEKSEVISLYAKIEKDERHAGIIRIYEKEVGERDFPEWTMGFHDLNAEGAKYLEGYDEFMALDFDIQKLHPSDALRLMKLFKASVR